MLGPALAGRDADAGRDFGYQEALRTGVFGCREAFREGVLAPGAFGGRGRGGQGCWRREALAPEKGGDPRSGEALRASAPLPARKNQKKAGKKCQPS